MGEDKNRTGRGTVNPSGQHWPGTRQRFLAPPPAPLSLRLLTEIAQTAQDRMNSRDKRNPVGPGEASTLGEITAIAVRFPGVLENLKDPDVPG